MNSIHTPASRVISIHLMSQLMFAGNAHLNCKDNFWLKGKI